MNLTQKINNNNDTSHKIDPISKENIINQQIKSNDNDFSNNKNPEDIET